MNRLVVFIGLFSYWLIVSIYTTWLANQLNSSFLLSKFFLFRTLPLEENGRLFKDFLSINRWKTKVFESNKSFGIGFNKTNLGSRSINYLRTYLMEINRGEWMHWFHFLHVIPLYFLINKLGFWLMFVYASLQNLPFILILRYNRPRIMRLIERLESSI